MVRLEGTNVKEGKALIESSGLDLVSAENLESAAKLAAQNVKALDAKSGGAQSVKGGK